MIASATNQPAAPEITAAFDREIVNVEGGSVRYLVISIKAPLLPPSDKPRDPINLGLVIDASGSMSGRPLDAAKRATVALLDKLAASDHLSLISFADDVVCHAEAVRLDAAGRETLTAAIRPLTTRGCTDLFGGWTGGCEAVATRRAATEASERNHVLLLSDGHANRGETDPRQLSHHASELRKRGVFSSTIGIGQQYSPVQLQAIAEAGGGRMHDAERPEEIAEIMFAELTDALATTVDDLELALRLPTGVEAELYGTTPLNRDAEGCEILAGSLIAGGSRQLVVKLTFPAGKNAETIPVAISARWKSPESEAHQACEVPPVAVRFERAESCVDQPRNRELARIVAEQWQAHIYHRAMLLNQDGQYEEATAFAERETRFLADYCRDLPGFAKAIHVLHEFSPSLARKYEAISSKEIFLQSYKMSRGETDRRSRKRQSLSEYVRKEARRRKP